MHWSIPVRSLAVGSQQWVVTTSALIQSPIARSVDHRESPYGHWRRAWQRHDGMLVGVISCAVTIQSRAHASIHYVLLPATSHMPMSLPFQPA
ncbi:hypothetical protein R69888_02206 [Paraburkholderia haematera]|uniref:Uncharacterized protein n=1 Tax=Paraburkholderia haematera TaxID=2793077 RepID=A0ABM8R5N9_9BURK|nr:hypothetical protein R69888_02206 [Paraburkholderia haematera]